MKIHTCPPNGYQCRCVPVTVRSFAEIADLESFRYGAIRPWHAALWLWLKGGAP